MVEKKKFDLVVKVKPVCGVRVSVFFGTGGGGVRSGGFGSVGSRPWVGRGRWARVLCLAPRGDSQ